MSPLPEAAPRGNAWNTISPPTYAAYARLSRTRDPHLTSRRMDEETAAGFVHSLLKEVNRLFEAEHAPFLVDSSAEPVKSLCAQVIMLFSDKERSTLHRKIVLRLLLDRGQDTSLKALSDAFQRAYTHVISHELRRLIPEGSLDALAQLDEQNAATLLVAHEISQTYEDCFLRLQRMTFAMVDDRIRAICLMIYRARLTLLREIAVSIRSVRDIHARLSCEQSLKTADPTQLLADCFAFSAKIRALKHGLDELSLRLGVQGGDPAVHPNLDLLSTPSEALRRDSAFILDKVLSASLRDPMARHVAVALPVEMLVVSLARRDLFGQLRMGGVYREVLKRFSLYQCLEAFSAVGEREKFWQVLFRASVEYLSAISPPRESLDYGSLYSDLFRLYLFLFDLYGLFAFAGAGSGGPEDGGGGESRAFETSVASETSITSEPSDAPKTSGASETSGASAPLEPQDKRVRLFSLLASLRTPFALSLGRVASSTPEVIPGTVPALEVFRLFAQRVHNVCSVFDYLVSLGGSLVAAGAPSESRPSGHRDSSATSVPAAAPAAASAATPAASCSCLWNAVFPDLRVGVRDFVRKLVKEECTKQAAMLASPPSFGLFRNAAAYELVLVAENTLVLHFPRERVAKSTMDACVALCAEVERRGSLRGCLQALDALLREEGVEHRVSPIALLDYARKYCADSQNVSILVSEAGVISSGFGFYPRTEKMTYRELFGECPIQFTSLASVSLLQSLATMSTLSRCVPRRDLAEGVIYTRQSIVRYISSVLGLSIKPIPRKAVNPLTTLFEYFVEEAEQERERVRELRSQRQRDESSRGASLGSPTKRAPASSYPTISRATRRHLPRGASAAGALEAMYTIPELFSPGLPANLLLLLGVYSLMRQTQALQPVLIKRIQPPAGDEAGEARSATVAALSCRLRILKEVCGVCVSRWFDFGPAFSMAFDVILRRYEASADASGATETTELPDLILAVVNRVLGTISTLRLHENVTGSDVLCAALGDADSGADSPGDGNLGTEHFYGQLQVAFWKVLYEDVCYHYTRQLGRVRRRNHGGASLMLADFSVLKRRMGRLLPLRPEDSVTDYTTRVVQYIQRNFSAQD